VDSEDCGKALAAEVEADVPEHEKRKAPGKNTVNGWKKVGAQLRAQHEMESAQGTTGTVRSREAKHAQMEEALYVWMRQMQGRDMPLTEVRRSFASKTGLARTKILRGDCSWTGLYQCTTTHIVPS
jgi:hypothetical protein